ncbi:MAG: hypothetical protein HZB15_13325 [Actinobacteria bacterium]|nr:hypothetical protein [Actinomycetota bacterium]
MSSLPPPPPGAQPSPPPSGRPLPKWAWLVVAVGLGCGGTALAFSLGNSDSDSRPSTSSAHVETTAALPATTTTTEIVVTTAEPTTTTRPAPTTVAPTTTREVVPSTSAPSGSATTVTGSMSPLPYDLAITDQWYVPSGDDIYDYGGIVENRGTQTATGYLAIEVDFYDATDRLISTETAFVDMVVPGTPTPFASVLVNPVAEPTRMDVRVSADSVFDQQPGPRGTVTVTNVAVVDESGFIDVTGDATSTFTVGLDYVQLVALWRGADGTVEFAVSGYLERLPAGGTEAFRISSFADFAPSTPPTEILVGP